jgi:NAD(P)H dehydrogenase (quinone)
VFLRNGWYSEGYLRTLDEAAATGSFLGSVGEGRVASASRQDFAEAAAVVLAEDGHDDAVYELSGDVAWSHPELAEILSRVLGRDVVYRDLSTDDHVAALVAAGLDEGSARFVAGLDTNIRDGVLADTPGDLSRLIGRPTTPIEQTLAAATAPTGR